MAYAPDVLRHLEALVRAGEQVPVLEETPPLDEYLLPIWDAFQVLHQSRQIGFSPCPIAVIDIVAYLDLLGIEGAERMEWFRLIKALDMTWMIEHNDKVSEPKKKG